MVVDYYSVDTKPTTTKMNSSYYEPEEVVVSSNHTRASLDVIDNSMFEVSDTIMVKGVQGYESDGVTQASSALILYVLGKDLDTGRLLVSAVNGKKIGSVENCVPKVYGGLTLVRMGRAATELDVQTAQFEALPVKAQNYCQIFKMQIEQSTLLKIANKEVEWPQRLFT